MRFKTQIRSCRYGRHVSTGQRVDRVAQGADADHPNALDQTRLRRLLGGHDQRSQPVASRPGPCPPRESSPNTAICASADGSS
jgi:hypothetical protein